MNESSQSSVTSSSDKFTCISCKLLFEDASSQSEHFHSDFHRFNLKRKVASLAPLTVAQFEKKQELEQAKLAGVTKHVFECKPCRRKFRSRNAFDSHVRSKRHLDKVGDSGEGSDDANEPVVTAQGKDSAQSKETDRKVETEEEWIEKKIRNAVSIDDVECCFCHHRSSTFELNLEHMARQHGFYVPYVDDFVDVKALVKYIFQKIGVGNVCISCERSFASLHAVQQHMIDKNHCKIPPEREADEEYAEFWLISSDEEDEDETTTSDSSSEDSEIDERPFGEPKPAKEVQKSKKPTASALSLEERMAKVAASRAAKNDAPMRYLVAVEDHKLVFNDGKSVGHRAFARYYKQKIRPSETRDCVLINRVRERYLQLGWQSNLPVAQRKELARSRKQKYSWQAKKNLQQGVRQNKLFVVRPQVIF